MICPVCGAEMEVGRVSLTLMGAGREAFPLLNWYPESEYHQTGIKSVFKRNGKTIRDTTVRETRAWYCAGCSKVLAEYEAKP